MIRISIQSSAEEMAALEAAQLLYLLVEFRPPDKVARERLPLNVCLVLDRSTSMRGRRLEQVKVAAAHIIRQMAPEDSLAVVTYSDRAEIVLPSQPVGNKHQLIGVIQESIASGGTEIFQGLNAGLAEIRKNPLIGHLNYLILLTDGHTYGDEALCLTAAKEAAGLGIGISAFGIGHEWNDGFLDALVAPSGGRSVFINAPDQIVSALQQRIQGLGDIYASNLRLRLDLPEDVRLKEMFKVAPFAQPLARRGGTTQLGAIEGYSPVAVLMELVVAPRPAGSELILPIKLAFDIPGQGVTNETVARSVRINFVIESEEQEPPAQIIEAVRFLNIHRMQDQVWNDVEAGRVQSATRRMERLTSRLREAGLLELAEQTESETQRLAAIGTMSLGGRKAIKYGTRTLMTQSLLSSEEEM